MSLTSDYTFRLGATGVVLNTDVSVPFVDITKVTGLASASYRETERDHEGQDGGFMDAEFEKGRHISLEGTVYANPSIMEIYLDSLKANFAPVSDPVPFYLLSPGVSTRIVFVKSLGVRYDWDSARRTGSADIVFVMFAEDPRQYSEALVQTEIDLQLDADTGFGFPFGFPLSFGSSVMPSVTTVTNSGNRPTPPVHVMPGPVTDPRVVKIDTNEVLAFNIIVAAGQTLRANTINRTVMLDNANRYDTLVRDDWFSLDPGGNDIAYRAESSSPATLTVEHRHAWR
jgi:hypothetical protein